MTQLIEKSFLIDPLTTSNVIYRDSLPLTSQLVSPKKPVKNLSSICQLRWAPDSVTNIYRRSHRRFSVRKDVLRNFAKFAGKQLCQGLFFNKVTGFRPTTLPKKNLWHRCFLLNFENLFYRRLLDYCFCMF